MTNTTDNTKTHRLFDNDRVTQGVVEMKTMKQTDIKLLEDVKNTLVEMFSSSTIEQQTKKI